MNAARRRLVSVDAGAGRLARALSAGVLVVGCGGGPVPPLSAPAMLAAAPSVLAPASAAAGGEVESAPSARSAKGAPGAVDLAKPAQSAGPADPPPAPPPIPKGTVVLHIGDSFTLSGFAQALKPRFLGVGARYEVRAEQSSFTTTWSGKLGPIVSATQPDLVIITLGANEVANTDPPAHAPAVRNIVKQLAGRPCVWVSPPLWAKETGIIDVLREHSAPCRFFDSDAIVKQPIPRRGDRIHPTPEGGAIWADAFWDWLGSERASDSPFPGPAGATKPAKRSPWLLREAPSDEHVPRGKKGAAPAPGG